ncbi:MAG TPA: peptide deformylase [Candidatus Paceibacterota bacterium]|nr:peptide deformylase [Candidatus Paceibacterota bacterium]
MVKILQRDEPVLRKIAEEVAIEEIKGSKIKKVIADMKAALKSQDDGVAIAAPQIGQPLRIFVISKELINNILGKEKEKDQKSKIVQIQNEVFINPVITKLSKDRQMMEEGCLSVRYLYGKVSRASRASIRAYDEDGRLFERGASGLLAQIFQHEVDHLNGILFIDSATDLEEVPPEKGQKSS